MKKMFEKPELDIVDMMVEDIITASSSNIEGSGSDTGGNHEFGERH